jgi:cysteinyl-tRNA synthetase
MKGGIILKNNQVFWFLILIWFSSCSPQAQNAIDFRQEMRNFVMEIHDYADIYAPGFIIVPQNGIELVTIAEGSLAQDYLTAVDGHGQEDLFWGYDGFDVATPVSEREWLQFFLDSSLAQGNSILVTDYGTDPDSYTLNSARGYVSFLAPSRELDQVPIAAPYNENSSDISLLNQVQNFLYLINPEQFSTRSAYLAALADTNFDLLILDAFYSDGVILSDAELSSLKVKKNGASRLVLCYLSIGEAEDYRYYWSQVDSAVLAAENPSWPGNFKVRYWMRQWKDVIFGSEDAYLDRILEAGFDGVYLDIIDAFEYFEPIMQ